MRLIDVDVLFKELNNKQIPWNRSINDIIMAQPTAYDVESVVKRFENMRDNVSRNIKLNSQSSDIKYEVECNERHYNKIIEIVRMGNGND